MSFNHILKVARGKCVKLSAFFNRSAEYCMNPDHSLHPPLKERFFFPLEAHSPLLLNNHSKHFFFFTFLRVLQPSKTGFYHLWSLVHFLFWLFFTLETILEYNTAASALLYHSLCSKMLAQATLWMDAGKSPYESQQCTKMILINTRIQYVSASLFKC